MRHLTAMGVARRACAAMSDNGGARRACVVVSDNGGARRACAVPRRGWRALT